MNEKENLKVFGNEQLKKDYIDRILTSVEIEPTQEEQVITAPEGYNGFNEVKVKGARLQQKIVTPSKEIQVIKADDGYYGLSDVIVSATPFNNDDLKVMLTDGANATPNDIKLGKTAFVGGKLITGTYETSGTIDITENGTYDISDYGTANVNIESGLKKYLDIRKTCQQMFYNNPSITDLTFIKYSDTENVTSMKQICAYSSNLTSFPLVDMRNVTTLEEAFYACSSLTSISFSDLTKCTTIKAILRSCNKLISASFTDTSNVQNFYNALQGCPQLTTVSTLDLRNATTVNYMFDNDSNIQNLTILNIKLNLQVGSGSSWGHLLTLESLIGLCQQCVNVGESRTLTIGSANITKLENIYVKLTDEAEEDETLPKIPMVQCESTDDGAMTISEYMTLKSWQIQ